MNSKKKVRRAKQTTIAQTDTPLSRAIDSFIDNKVDINDLKEEQTELERRIIEEMKKEKRDILVISHGGEQWEFEVLDSQTKLRCAKKSKTPVSEKQMEF